MRNGVYYEIFKITRLFGKVINVYNTWPANYEGKLWEFKFNRLRGTLRERIVKNGPRRWSMDEVIDRGKGQYFKCEHADMKFTKRAEIALDDIKYENNQLIPFVPIIVQRSTEYVYHANKIVYIMRYNGQFWIRQSSPKYEIKSANKWACYKIKLDAEFRVRTHGRTQIISDYSKNVYTLIKCISNRNRIGENLISA